VKHAPAIIAMAVSSFMSPATAQSPVQVPLFDGALVLHGDVGVLSDQRAADGASVEVWRPILFGTPERPIGGRMDCRLGAVEQMFSNELFDLEQRYEDSEDRREAAGLNDDKPTFTQTGLDNAPANAGVRRLEVTGRANNPHRHYVLTYLAMREGSRLYDIRLNCTFLHHHNLREEPDYAAIMHNYIDIAVPIPLSDPVRSDKLVQPAELIQPEGQ